MEEEYEEEIEEAQSFVIAGLSLTRKINIEDIKWAVEQGFNKGYKKALSEKTKTKK